MSGFTDAEEQAIIDAEIIAKNPWFLALFTADPTDTGSTANELTNASSPGYARLSVTMERTGSTFQPNADAVFANPTADWQSATHVAFCAAGVAGVADVKGVMALDAAKQALTNKPLEFLHGQLTFTLD